MSATTMIWLSPDDAPRAVDFYTNLFDDSRVVAHHTFANPSQPSDSEMWELILNGSTVHVMGSAHHQPPSMALSLVVTVADQETLDRYWNAIVAAGGKEMACGWIVDPFGVFWQIEPQYFYDVIAEGDPAKAQRVAESLWQMVKIDIATLQRAATD